MAHSSIKKSREILIITRSVDSIQRQYKHTETTILKDTTKSAEESRDNEQKENINNQSSTNNEILCSTPTVSKPAGERKSIRQANTSITTGVTNDNNKSKMDTSTCSSKNTSVSSINRSVCSKKPVVGRKSIEPKYVEPFKEINSNRDTSVEKILKDIKMTKYQQAFQKINLTKFKQLKEIDLNAIGITRQVEIQIFKQAILRAQSDTNWP